MLAEGLGRLIVGAKFDDDGIAAGTRLRFGDRDPRDRSTAVERVEAERPIGKGRRDRVLPSVQDRVADHERRRAAARHGLGRGQGEPALHFGALHREQPLVGVGEHDRLGPVAHPQHLRAGRQPADPRREAPPEEAALTRASRVDHDLGCLSVAPILDQPVPWQAVPAGALEDRDLRRSLLAGRRSGHGPGRLAGRGEQQHHRGHGEQVQPGRS